MQARAFDVPTTALGRTDSGHQSRCSFAGGRSAQSVAAPPKNSARLLGVLREVSTVRSRLSVKQCLPVTGTKARP